MVNTYAERLRTFMAMRSAVNWQPKWYFSSSSFHLMSASCANGVLASQHCFQPKHLQSEPCGTELFVQGHRSKCAKQTCGTAFRASN